MNDTTLPRPDRFLRSLPGRCLALLAGLALLPLLAGCDEGVSGPGDGDGEAALSVRLTDAHGDVESVWIDVTELRLVGDAEGDGSGGVTLLSDADDDDPGNDGDDDLLELSPDAVHDLVDEEPVPAGSYGQLRLVVGAAVLETETGLFLKGDPDLSALPGGIGDKPQEGTLHCPSCSQTGIKIVPPGGALELEDATTLVLDFDVHQSFGRQAGASGMWVMHPVILATVLDASATVSGTVTTAEGVSVPECGGAARSVQDFVPQLASVDDPATVKSGEVQEDGSYEIDFLQTGDWTATHAGSVELDGGASLEFEATADPGEVTVEAGETAVVDYTITAASCSGV